MTINVNKGIFYFDFRSRLKIDYETIIMLPYLNEFLLMPGAKSGIS